MEDTYFTNRFNSNFYAMNNLMILIYFFMGHALNFVVLFIRWAIF